MRSISQPILIMGVLMTVLLLTGCGSTPFTNTPGPASTPTTPPSLSSTSLVPPRGGEGPVTLRTDALLYQPDATILVILSNGSQHALAFPDHLTNCTVILLQRATTQPRTTGTESDGINPCRLASLTRLHTLGPGQQLVVPLIAPQGGWPPGRYLALLSYQLSPGAGPATAISSPAFTIGSPAPQP